ncbi:hypothetical protein [Microbulbifer sp. 2205BS26-8]|uniref:hypothetical protein n=1 Tax=Microbulbifer sp. 2205BS26-8 TaxID=3064386 RepID=UPI00273DF9AE|nr:hypothetical protein [Microbulbifer sp. 2205BS26-8]MDP5208747.1 hypothetical protein [Microbulbifer sp. 2205BS26-8]
MHQFSILAIFVLAFGGAAVLYEQESRKVKGVLTQITELQAQMGDLQAEVNRLNSELEAVKLAERRRPNLNTMANRIRREAPIPMASKPVVEKKLEKTSSGLVVSDVTMAPPATRSKDDSSEEDRDWSRPSVDANQYQKKSGEQEVLDPYQ